MFTNTPLFLLPIRTEALVCHCQQAGQDFLGTVLRKENCIFADWLAVADDPDDGVLPINFDETPRGCFLRDVSFFVHLMMEGRDAGHEQRCPPPRLDTAEKRRSFLITKIDRRFTVH